MVLNHQTENYFLYKDLVTMQQQQEMISERRGIIEICNYIKKRLIPLIYYEIISYFYPSKERAVDSYGNLKKKDQPLGLLKRENRCGG